MDIILGRFADRHIEGFDEEHLEEFEQVLAIADPDLYNWITGKEKHPAHLGNRVLQLLIHSHS